MNLRQTLAMRVDDALRPLLATLGRPTAYLLLALAFSLPLWPGIPVVLLWASFGTTVALAVRSTVKVRWVFHDPALWLLLFYALHVIGLLWTSNLEFGLFDLDSKSPLLLFALMALLLPRLDSAARRAILTAFVAGAAASVLLHVGLAFARIAAGSEFTAVQEFYSSRFSLPVHPSYMALYLCVAVAVWYLYGLHEQVSRTLDLSILLVLCAGIVFCGSKAGWLVMLLLLPVLLLLRWKNARTRGVVLTALSSSVLAIVMLVLVSPNARDRVLGAIRAATEEQHRPDASTSSEVRWHTWSAAWHLFRKAPLHGTGTGDIKDALLATYEERGNTTALEHELNAHDQFLQTAACLGVSGAVVLVVLLLLPLMAPRSIGSAAAIVSGIWIVNMLVESMLEVQAGTLLFGFCILLLFRSDVRPPAQREHLV